MKKELMLRDFFSIDDHPPINIKRLISFKKDGSDAYFGQYKIIFMFDTPNTNLVEWVYGSRSLRDRDFSFMQKNFGFKYSVNHKLLASKIKRNGKQLLIEELETKHKPFDQSPTSQREVILSGITNYYGG